MKYSIFHTSHCGSTLLAAKLSKSIPTLTEPNWSHDLKEKEIKEIPFIINELANEDYLIKYSSHFPYLAALLEGKKVFLYRKLNHHLQKFNHLEKAETHLDYAYKSAIKAMNSKMRNAIKSKFFNLYDIKEALAFFWVNRFLWMKQSQNILAIDSNEFFKNQDKVCEDICKWFNIEYKPIDINFHVKIQASCNLTSEPLDWTKFKEVDKTYDASKDILQDSDNQKIVDICTKIKNTFYDLEEFI